MDKTQLDVGLREALATDRSDYVKDAAAIWSAWAVPAEHEWVHSDINSAMAEADDSGRNPLDHLSVAVCNDLEAFAVMQSWKVWELCETLVVALNSTNLVTAAGAARSAIETTCVLSDMAYRSGEAFQPTTDAATRLAAVTRLAEATEKAIWGGRAGLTKVEPISALTFRDRVVKRTSDEDTKTNLLRTYEILCDMVHPSALGHQLYWASGVASPAGDQWIIPLRFGELNDVAVSTMPLLAWTLGWSVSWSRRAIADITQRAERLRRIVTGEQ